MNDGDLVVLSLNCQFFPKKLKCRRNHLNTSRTLDAVETENTQLLCTLHIRAHDEPILGIAYLDPVKLYCEHISTSVRLIPVLTTYIVLIFTNLGN